MPQIFCSRRLKYLNSLTTTKNQEINHKPVMIIGSKNNVVSVKLHIIWFSICVNVGVRFILRNSICSVGFFH